MFARRRGAAEETEKSNPKELGLLFSALLAVPPPRLRVTKADSER
jgi:hypothetical protein